MQTLEYRTIDKSTWGDGPWQDEPDKLQYPDPATGLPCLIVRTSHAGNLCGYVGVPPSHSLHGKNYDDVNVSVHGGLTFADTCQPHADESDGICHLADEGEPDNVFWFGFDCAHYMDLSPAYASQFPLMDSFNDTNSTYRDLAYVKSEVASLAKQLHETA